ncbi:Hypothetical protein LUCI_0123 [Lucifera butyrica]|uniref:Ecf transporter substrate-specific component n=1 Tax=Lucifera butyrica TaxID=1351585 RepID=A0A498R273_9FIRM|nr:ECF transporter S component [Lucifera butyrica]VBB04917.1 Hypothetical protein LUCI_0123 [Lucifera butyrica]
MNKKNMWSFQFSTASLVLIPAAVGINYLGKLFAGVLKLPLWLDSIGTMLSAMLAGPIVGALCGIINNVIYGLTMDPISFIYALTSMGIGLAVGVMNYKGYLKNIGSVIACGFLAALVAAVISTPINVSFWGGQTGNVWGDIIYAYFIAHGSPVWIASFLDEVIVDIPDKIATVLIAYAIFKGLPRSLTVLYRNDQQIEKL